MHGTLPSDHAPAFFTASRKLRRRPELEPCGAYSVSSLCPGLVLIRQDRLCALEAFVIRPVCHCIPVADHSAQHN